ncbi:MAG: zinc ribbon domain-containing protein [Paludibacteraceae bacterium]|nr:zinc ribbon domain-containing protein [Paludibacteraceae bacterium]
MRNCPSCGAPIDEHMFLCPYCETVVIPRKNSIIRKSPIPSKSIVHNAEYYYKNVNSDVLVQKKLALMYMEENGVTEKEAFMFIKNIYHEQQADFKRGILTTVLFLAVVALIVAVIAFIN